MHHNLIKRWTSQIFDNRPFFLEEDRHKLNDERTTSAQSYKEFTEHVFSISEDEKVREKYRGRIHGNLLPVPFQGNLEKADIFICLINPGLSALDYIVEKNGEYRELLKKNLKQDLAHEKYPLFSLDPKWLWTGGGIWWSLLFRPVIQEMIERNRKENISYHEAARTISQRVAVLELFPYHSANSGLIRGLGKLPSVQLMKDYVREEILPKVKKREVLLVIASGARIWGVPEGLKNVVYQPKNHRKAELSMEKDCSGDRILRRLLT